MRLRTALTASALLTVFAATALPSISTAKGSSKDPARLAHLASYNSGSGEAGSEIVAFDDRTTTMLITNGARNRIDVVSIANPAAPTLVRTVELTSFGGGVQSVAANKGKAVAVVTGATVLDPGTAVVFDIESGEVIATAPTGVLPDNVAWSKEGDFIVIPNEGEPRCVTGASRVPTKDPLLAENPEGSVTVLKVSSNGRKLETRQVAFTEFNGLEDMLRAKGVRVGTWPGSTAAQDLEPEYATISGKTAYVTLQENNAVAIVDLERAMVLSIVPLGLKDHRVEGNQLDPSDRDGGYASGLRPVTGMFMPDAIDSLKHRGETYLLTANEGDTRTYFAGIENAEVAGNECFADEVRVRSLSGGLDPDTFGGAAAVTALRDNAQLGRLKVSSVFPSVRNAAGRYTEISGFGARSMTVWNSAGQRVWDSGSLLESTVNGLDGARWPDVAGNTPPWATAPYDNRSDDKGPEPEALAVGEHKGRTYAFLGLERAGGVMLFDVSEPTAPVFLRWLTVPGDISPEGITFVRASDSPTKNPLVLVGNEISGTTSVLSLDV